MGERRGGGDVRQSLVVEGVCRRISKTPLIKYINISLLCALYLQFTKHCNFGLTYSKI